MCGHGVVVVVGWAGTLRCTCTYHIHIHTPLSGGQQILGEGATARVQACVCWALWEGNARCAGWWLLLFMTPQLQGWGDEREAVRSLPEGREPSLRSELCCRVALTQEPPCSGLVCWLTVTSRRSSPDWWSCCLLTPGRLPCKKLFGNFPLVAVLTVANLPWPRGGVCHLNGSFTSDSVCGWWGENLNTRSSRGFRYEIPHVLCGNQCPPQPRLRCQGPNLCRVYQEWGGALSLLFQPQAQGFVLSGGLWGSDWVLWGSVFFTSSLRKPSKQGNLEAGDQPQPFRRKADFVQIYQVSPFFLTITIIKYQKKTFWKQIWAISNSTSDFYPRLSCLCL